MCIGIPMKIIAHQGDYYAMCDGMNQQKTVSMMLIGQQPIGSWLLVFQSTARELLDEQRAEHIADALTAVSMTMEGNNSTSVEHLFSDLVNREPELPDFLKSEYINKEDK